MSPGPGVSPSLLLLLLSSLLLARCGDQGLDPEPRLTGLTCPDPFEQPAGLIAFVGSEVSFADPTVRLTLHVVNADGSGLRELTAVGNDTHGNPSFSPDGQWIAFQAPSDFSQSDIYKIRADGSGLVNLTAPLGGAWASPTWSPDGRMLAVSARDAGFEIVLIDAETGAFIQQVTTQFAGSVAITSAFTPDGEFLIVSGPPAEGGPQERSQEDLWEVRFSDGTVRRITDTPQDERFVDLSPDGGLIAVFSEATEPGPLGVFPAEIFIVDRFTGVKTRVTYTPAVRGRFARQADSLDPAWSPGGCYLVFESSREGSVVDTKLFIQPIDRVEPRQLTFIPTAVQADWSPR